MVSGKEAEPLCLISSTTSDLPPSLSRAGPTAALLMDPLFLGTMPAVDGETTITQPRQHSTIDKHKRLLLIRKLPPLMYIILPYVIGLAWTVLHPLLSIVTGETKCRGAYIDENGLDVRRYRIPGYPTSRLLRGSSKDSAPTSSSEDDDNDDGATDDGGRMTTKTNHRGMCHALRRLLRPSSSEFVDCLTHATTTTTIHSNDDNNNRQQKQQHHQQIMIVSFDTVRIIPTLGPMKDMTEAIVLVVGGSHRGSSSGNRGTGCSSTQEETCNNDDNTANNDDDDSWYNNNDMNASIIRLISRLSNSNDCPWLNKVIYIVSPNNNNNNNNNNDNVHLGDVVDAFLSSYLGDDTNTNHHSSNHDDDDDDTPTMLLPLDYTHPIIRSLIVINDVHDDDIESTATATTTKSKVKILPQAGINNGILPNLDLVFATTMSFQSQPSNSKDGRWDRSKSLYYSGIGSSSSSENNEQREPHFTAHPNYYGSTTTTTMIEKYTCMIMHYVFVTILKYDSTKLNQYINDMFGMLYFLISMIIGP